MEENTTLIAVFGYGCLLNDHIKHYLSLVSVNVSIYTQGNKIIFLSGGFTDPIQAPEISEAKMMAGYLQDLLRKQEIEAEIILDEQATTTIENMRNLLQEVSKINSPSLKNVLIFCEKSRKLKIFLLRGLLGRKIKTRIKIQGVDFEVSLSQKIQQVLIKTPFELLCSLIPALERFFIQRLLIKRQKPIN